jgi:flavin reductase (DIM6/NTAB) family NADH-FMN oxidoreductase RutF
MMSQNGFDSRAFRSALGQFQTGVAIVSALAADGAPVGMTINSFSSVSLEPPLILWSVQSNSPSSAAFLAAKHFAVTILAADQKDLASKFARTAADKFDGIPTRRGIGNILVPDGGIATFECETWALYPGGDHEIMLGLVRHFHTGPGEALGFHRGQFLASGNQ